MPRIAWAKFGCRAVFILPDSADGVPSERLAYIERIAKFTTPDSDHQMFKLNRSVENGEQVASIVPASTIRRSAHLLKFGSAVFGQCARGMRFILS